MLPSMIPTQLQEPGPRMALHTAWRKHGLYLCCSRACQFTHTHGSQGMPWTASCLLRNRWCTEQSSQLPDMGHRVRWGRGERLARKGPVSARRAKRCTPSLFMCKVMCTVGVQ